ncbi:MAG: RNA methyltransferase [Chitinophagaceae bacterium]|nr:RNA methyltransferase [Chitinophagaceae bacterium]
MNSLKQKKHRIEEGRFIAEGEKIAEEFLTSRLRTDKIIATREWLDEKENLWNKKKATVLDVSEIEMKRISGLTQPSRVLLVLEMIATEIDDSMVKSNINLVLEDIRDPGNMGTIIRIADWFGIPYIFCSEECVDVYNPKVVQASMGSVTRVKVIEMKLPGLFQRFPSLPAYAAHLEGENIFSTNLKQEGFIVIGNEARGLSEALVPFIHKKITIPKFGKAESLNAAVATGIVCAMFRTKM